MSDERAGAPGAGAAIGLVLIVGVVGLLGFAAYTALSTDLPGAWIYAAVAGALVLGHLAALAGSVSLVTRGVASVAYVMAAVAVTLLVMGVDRDATPLVFGIALESAVPWGLAALIAVGALALPAMPSSTPGRVIGGLLALAAVAPWVAGIVGGDTPEAILAGDRMFYAGWPRLAQPALIGGGVALAALLLVGVAALGGKKRADQRILAACALIIPGLAAAVMVTYAFSSPPASDGSATGEPVAIDAGTEATSDASAPSAGRSDAGAGATPVASGRETCSGVVFASRDIAAIRAGFASERWRDSALAFLELRYPDAAWMIGTLEDPASFDVWFKGQTGSFDDVMGALGTGVHEAAHMAGLQHRTARRHRFVVARDRFVEMPVPKTYHRSEIAADLPAPIREMSYRKTYLEGDSGAQGYEMVLEELNAYTYSLLVGIATLDTIPKSMSISSRDGLLTLMYYTEAYLRRARTKRPESYAAITGDPAIVAATLALYDRAACVMALSGSDSRLGIEDAMLREHVFGAERLGEIDRLR